jgi:hypothetical protein
MLCKHDYVPLYSRGPTSPLVPPLATFVSTSGPFYIVLICLLGPTGPLIPPPAIFVSTLGPFSIVLLCFVEEHKENSVQNRSKILN